MRSFFTLGFACLLSLCSYAQSSYEWSTAAQGVSMNYVKIEAHPDSGYVALADKTQIDLIRRKETVLRHCRGGETRDLTELRNDNGAFIVRLDDQGGLIWALDVPHYRGEVMGMTVTQKGEIFILGEFQPARNDYYYDDESEEEENVSGLGFIKISSTGQASDLIPITGLHPEVDLDITNFCAYRDQGFLIAGDMNEGKLVTDLDAEAYKGGGNFILMVDNEGTPSWADVVSSRSGECCPYAPENKCVSVAPDGTIYLGGSYKSGGIFSNGLQTMTPKKYGSEVHRSTETFVVAYSPKGKIKWVQTDQTESRLLNLCATDKGVFVVHWVYHDKSFGDKLDTTDAKFKAITLINPKGKVKWSVSTNVESLDEMVPDGHGDVYAVGRATKYGRFDRTLGRESFSKQDRNYVVRISSKGRVKMIWSHEISASREPMRMACTQDESIVVSCEIWCGLSIDLSRMEKGLPSLDCQAGVPILFEIKR